MHHCLSNAEIQNEIFKYLAHRGSSKTLAALAGTCRTFQEEAMTVLWKESYVDIYSLMIRGLPRGTWELRRRTLPASSLVISLPRIPLIFQKVLVRSISLEEWDESLHHASNARSVVLDGFADSSFYLMGFKNELPEEIYNCCWLPGLLKARIDMVSAGYFLPVDCILGPSLTSLSLRLQVPTFHLGVSNVLQSIPIASPAIRYLSIAYTLRPPALACRKDDLESLPPFQNLIKGLSSLISLDLEWKGCDPRMITGLVELPIRPATRFSLAILALPARKQDDCTRPVNAAAKADNSPRLVELELKDLIWKAAAGVVGRLKNGIEKLAVNGNDAPTPPSTFNAMFAATSHLTSLTELRLIASIASIPDDPKTLDASAVDILFDLPNIVHFEHRSPIVPLLTDAWLERAAVAWPKLRTLTVTFAVYYHPAPKMTLEGLVPLLNTSKYLRELDVQVVCRPFPMDRLEGTQRNGVWKVSFSESVVADHEGLVDCILAMFPLLQVFGGYADQDESGKGLEDWQRVEREWKGARRL